MLPSEERRNKRQAVRFALMWMGLSGIGKTQMEKALAMLQAFIEPYDLLECFEQQEPE